MSLSWLERLADGYAAGRSDDVLARGDAGPREGKVMTRSPEELAVEFLPLAMRIAGVWAKQFRWLRDEFRSAAGMALWKCARRYRPERGQLFHNYVRKRVWGACQDACRDALPQGFRRKEHAARRAGTPEPEFFAGIPDDHGRLSLDLLPSRELPVGWELESADAVDELTRKLTSRQRDAVRLYFLGAGMTLGRVGKVMGCAESNVCVLVRYAIKAMKGEQRSAQL